MFFVLKHIQHRGSHRGDTAGMCPNPYPAGSWDCRRENMGGGSGFWLNQTSLLVRQNKSKSLLTDSFSGLNIYQKYCCGQGSAPMENLITLLLTAQLHFGATQWPGRNDAELAKRITTAEYCLRMHLTASGGFHKIATGRLSKCLRWKNFKGRQISQSKNTRNYDSLRSDGHFGLTEITKIVATRHASWRRIHQNGSTSKAGTGGVYNAPINSQLAFGATSWQGGNNVELSKRITAAQYTVVYPLTATRQLMASFSKLQQAG